MTNNTLSIMLSDFKIQICLEPGTAAKPMVTLTVQAIINPIFQKGSLASSSSNIPSLMRQC